MKNARENQMKAVPKVSKSVVFAATLACLIVLACTATYAQITPSQDAYTNTNNPTTNYGANVLLDVDGAIQIAYIQFNLASIPSGASVSQATLKLYANAVTKAGSFNVDYINGTWSENTITSNMAPALGNAITSNVSLTAADKNQYILIDITAALQAWLSGTANDGIALVANGNFNATFDSKENTTTSHPAELDIVFAGGGTITGVTTANGSGLTGGGTSGTLELSLTNACAAKQVLQWSGSAWACSAVGTGTITAVTAGSDLTGGGTSGSVTLNLDTTKVPQLAAANTFTANQTVNGSVTATSFTGSGAGLTGITAANANELGGLAPSAFAQLNTYNGFLANTSSYVLFAGQEGTGNAIQGQTLSSTGYGVLGAVTSTTGTAAGVLGTTTSTSGFGVEGTSPNVGVFGSGTGSGGIGLDGHGTIQGVKGVATEASGASTGVYGNAASETGYGVEGTSSYAGVYGQAAGASKTGQLVFNNGRGVWGDAGGEAGSFYGVLGTADENVAGYFLNNSSEDGTLFAENEETFQSDAPVFQTSGGNFEGQCMIDVSGNLTCSGKIGGEAELAGGARKVALYAMQSPENWFEDFGSSALSTGAATVTLDPAFTQTVNTGTEYHVFLTANGDCKGLYVAQKSGSSFEVRELGGGQSNVAFDYRIVAKRVGYENVRLADITEQFNKNKAQQQRMRQAVRPPAGTQSAPNMPALPVPAVQPVRHEVKLVAVPLK